MQSASFKYCFTVLMNHPVLERVGKQFLHDFNFHVVSFPLRDYCWDVFFVVVDVCWVPTCVKSVHIVRISVPVAYGLCVCVLACLEKICKSPMDYVRV